MTAYKFPSYDLPSQFQAFESLKKLGSNGGGVRIAIIDGAIDVSAPSLSQLQILQATDQPATLHGTMVANILAGTPMGVANACELNSFPAFSENQDGHLIGCSELSLGRKLSEALSFGCGVINVSGANAQRNHHCHDILRAAIHDCHKQNAILVAAVGNHGRDTEAIPASIEGVLAVGSHDKQGDAASFNNFGPILNSKTLLAPGVDILCEYEHQDAFLSGSSFAAPFVSGICALLQNIQPTITSSEINDLLWRSSIPALSSPGGELSGQGPRRLDLVELINNVATMSGGILAQNHSNTGRNIDMSAIDHESNNEVQPAQAELAVQNSEVLPSAAQVTTPPAASSQEVTVSETGTTDHFLHMPPASRDASFDQPAILMPQTIAPQGHGPNINGDHKVFALGKIGYDFLTEANRDYFMNIMKANQSRTGILPHPNDPIAMARFLNWHDENNQQPFIDNATALTWTLKIDDIPIYAIQPQDQFAIMEIGRLINFLFGQAGINPHALKGMEAEAALKAIHDDSNDDVKSAKVDRVSIPGNINGEVVLYNGQVVPVIEPILRGMFSWNSDVLARLVLPHDASEDEKKAIENFLARIYYELRNRGETSSERALNFMATNCYSAGEIFADAFKRSLQLNTLRVERSPISRPGGDFWDVIFEFFNPKRIHEEANRVYRQTVDVSELMPITIGQLRSWDAYPPRG